jgi:hypothetical protein
MMEKSIIDVRVQVKRLGLKNSGTSMYKTSIINGVKETLRGLFLRTTTKE